MSQAQNSHHTINEHGKALRIKISSSIGEEHLKTSFLSFVSSAIQKEAKGVLIDNHELNHHISPHFQAWAQQNLELPLFHAGVDKIAIVHPNDANFFNLIAKNDTKRRRYFSTAEEAQAWLDA